MNIGFPPVLAAEDEESDALILRTAEYYHLRFIIIFAMAGRNITESHIARIGSAVK